MKIQCAYQPIPDARADELARTSERSLTEANQSLLVGERKKKRRKTQPRKLERVYRAEIAQRSQLSPIDMLDPFPTDNIASAAPTEAQ